MTILPARRRWARMPKGRLTRHSPEDLHAQAFPEGNEPLVDRLGLETLHHRRERACPAGNDPCPGLVPVAHMRDADHRTAAGRDAIEDQLPVPSSVMPSTRRSTGMTGSRKISSQYRP